MSHVWLPTYDELREQLQTVTADLASHQTRVRYLEQFLDERNDNQLRAHDSRLANLENGYQKTSQDMLKEMKKIAGKLLNLDNNQLHNEEMMDRLYEVPVQVENIVNNVTASRSHFDVLLARTALNEASDTGLLKRMKLLTRLADDAKTRLEEMHWAINSSVGRQNDSFEQGRIILNNLEPLKDLPDLINSVNMANESIATANQKSMEVALQGEVIISSLDTLHKGLLRRLDRETAVTQKFLASTLANSSTQLDKLATIMETIKGPQENGVCLGLQSLFDEVSDGRDEDNLLGKVATLEEKMDAVLGALAEPRHVEPDSLDIQSTASSSSMLVVDDVLKVGGNQEYQETSAVVWKKRLVVLWNHAIHFLWTFVVVVCSVLLFVWLDSH